MKGSVKMTDPVSYCTFVSVGQGVVSRFSATDSEGRIVPQETSGARVNYNGGAHKEVSM